MHSCSMSDLQRKIGEVAELALSAPVSITRNGRDKYVLLTTLEYNRLKRRDREVLGVEELEEEDIRAIAMAEVPEEHNYLNDLLTEE